VRLVKHTAEDVDVYSSQAISRARKKMMAEIALAGDEVVIDDVAYSRNDASTLLDVITEENWKTHSIIYVQKGLLNFLEKEEFNDEEMRKADAYLYNAPFVAAVSPYFAHSFNSVSGKLIRQENFDELYKLLNYQGYILPEHSHEAYQKIRTYLDELNYTLRNLSWEKFSADESILHFIFSDEWRRFLNKLPSAFTSLRDELVEHMIGIVLRFQHKATWYYLHRVLVQLKGVETNDFNRSEIERIDKVIYENSKIEGNRGTQTTPRKNDEVSTGRIIWWAVWIVLIIIRVATCNNNNKTTYNFQGSEALERLQQIRSARVDEKKTEAQLLDYMDSLSQVQSLSVNDPTYIMQTGNQPFASIADVFPVFGPDTVYITNNTGFDCVALLSESRMRSFETNLSVLPKIAAVYIKKGDVYKFPYSPSDDKRFYFLFGEKWGSLKSTAEIIIRTGNRYANMDEGKQLVMLYEFFSNKKPVKQNYLQQAVFIQKATSDRNEEEFQYLNNPYDAALNDATHIKLVQKNKRFAVEAKGSLLVKEERKRD